ncbi:MAG: hypothetical protein LBU91_03385 [Bacteroidales bacterium]|jgi:hypothetical protein|nr:hypothetical protein [Bacteroidales bacterium]
MKQFFKTTATIAAALIITMTACKKTEEKPNPAAPKQATLTTTATSLTDVCDSETITLTATSEDATSYQWEKKIGATGTWVVDATSTTATLEVTCEGYFPDERSYRVSGKNAIGPGRASDEKTIIFKACSTPEKPIITGENNTTTNYVELTARGKYATEYRWYLNDELILDEEGEPVKEAVCRFKKSGTYTVVGVNANGTEGVKSDGKAVVYSALDPFDITGEWYGVAKFDNLDMEKFEYFWDNAAWTTTIEPLKDSLGNVVSDTIFVINDYAGLFTVFGFMPAPVNLIVYKDKDGDYYIPNNATMVGFGGFFQSIQGVVRDDFEGYNLPDDYKLYFDVSADQTAFRVPQTITVDVEGTPTELATSVTMQFSSGSDYLHVLDLAFVRPEEAAPYEAKRWVSSPKNAPIVKGKKAPKQAVQEKRMR